MTNNRFAGIFTRILERRNQSWNMSTYKLQFRWFGSLKALLLTFAFALNTVKELYHIHSKTRSLAEDDDLPISVSLEDLNWLINMAIRTKLCRFSSKNIDGLVVF